MSIEKSDFGKTADGKAVDLYTLKNKNGMVVKIITFGGIITEIHVPDRTGKLGNVVLGFDNLEQYKNGHPFFGAIAGRVANRIGKGKFQLEGKEYTLAINNGPNHLHGGIKGFDKVVWQARQIDSPRGPSLQLKYRSPDGEEGYPGNLDVVVNYTLGEANELEINYQATTDKTTILNITNHSYFNLAGGGTVLEHEVFLAASNYTDVDEGLIPTGEIKSVKGTPLDFTTPRKIGERIKEIPAHIKGYDHNFVIDSGGITSTLAARVYEPSTGRVLETYTTEPGIQLYTGNHLNGSLKGLGGTTYIQHAGFCLETQHYPDSVNKPQFPTVVLKPGETFKSTTSYKFSIR